MILLAIVVLLRPSSALALDGASSAYAVITQGTDGYADDTLLFFRSPQSYANDSDAIATYVDTAGNTYRGVVYAGIESDSYTQGTQPWATRRQEITSVAFAPGQVIRPVSTAYWFEGLVNVSELALSEVLDTSQATSMRSMFEGCLNLPTIDVSSLDTSSVTDMNGMFAGCVRLSSLDLSHFDTRRVTDMGRLLSHTALSTIDLSSLRTPVLANVGEMFAGCAQLSSLDLSSLDLSQVSDAHGLLNGCVGLASVDLSHVELAGVMDASELMKDCSQVERVDLMGFSNTAVTTLVGAFSGCASLRDLNLMGFDLASRAVDLSDVFAGCGALERVRLSEVSALSAATLSFPAYSVAGRTTVGKWANLANSDVTYVADSAVGGALPEGTYGWAAQAMWRLTGDDAGVVSGNAPTELHFSMQPTNDIETGWQELKSYRFSGDDRPPWLSHASSIRRVILDTGVWGLTSGNALFSQMPNVTEFTHLDRLDTSGVTKMTDMFYKAKSVSAIDVTHFDFSQVDDMAGMFQECTSLTSVEFSRISSSRLVRTWAMFNGCTSLTSVRLGSLRLGSPTGLTGSEQGQTRMFISCRNLVELDLSACDLSDVTDAGGMLQSCSSIERIMLPGDMDRGAKGTWFRFPTWGSGGRWMRADDPTTAYASEASLGDIVLTGTYVRKTVAMWKLTGDDGADDGSNVELHLAAMPEGVAPSGWGTIGSNYTYNGVRPGWSAHSSEIRRVVLDNRVAGLTSGNSLFFGLSNVLEYVNLRLLDTSAMTDMRNMFCNNRMARTIDVSEFVIARVTDMAGFFQNCSSMTEADLSGFDGSALGTTFLMFGGCTSLQRVWVGKAITQATTETRLMFQNCTGLVELDLSGCDLTVQSASNLQTMLSGCSALDRIVLPAVSVAGFCFPASIDGAHWSNAVTGETFNAGASMGPLTFGGGTYRRDLPLHVWRVTGAGGGAIVDGMPTELHLKSQFSDDVAGGWAAIADSYSLSRRPAWDMYASSLTKVVIDASMLGVTSTAYWLSDLDNVTSVEGLSKLSMAKVGTMSHMFSGCQSLRSVDLSSFKTSAVADMSYLFSGCNALVTINVSGLDTTRVVSMEGMFQGCSQLTSLALSSFGTEAVVTMKDMLDGCDELESVTFNDDGRFHSDGGGMAVGDKGFRFPSYGIPSGYTGRWTNDVLGMPAATSLEAAILRGTWHRQLAITVAFDSAGGEGGIERLTGGAVDEVSMPSGAEVSRLYRRLVGWSVSSLTDEPSWAPRGEESLGALLAAKGVTGLS